MEIKSPCMVCKRVNDDKRNCVVKCPAIESYRKVCKIGYTTKGFDKINNKLKKLADDHAGQFTEEHTDSAEIIPESDEDGGMFMSDMEIDPDLSDELDIDETQKSTDSEDVMTKKRKYTKKIVPANDVDVSETIVLDMSNYQQIARLLKIMSEETMLPQEHIVMSFIGKGLSRE